MSDCCIPAKDLCYPPELQGYNREADIIILLSQPRKLRPREGKPLPEVTQHMSGGLGAGAWTVEPQGLWSLDALPPPSCRQKTKRNVHFTHKERQGQRECVTCLKSLCKLALEAGLEPGTAWVRTTGTVLFPTSLLEAPGEPVLTGVGETGRSTAQQTRARLWSLLHITALPPGNCVALNQSLSLSVPQFLHWA